MSSGKKGKKTKGKTLSLTEYLAESGTTVPNVPLKQTNWADDVDDEFDGFPSRGMKEPVVLPTAPRASREPGPRGHDSIDEENVPTNPPYIAYISNLPYDIDEEDIAAFFDGLKIANTRLPRESNKSRGYGYVEFEDRQNLIDALSMSNSTIKTRPVRIEVSNSSNDERRGGRMGRENRRDNYDDPERTSGDWRSGPRDDTSGDNDRYRSRFDNRDRRDDRESTDNKPGAWRESSDRGRPNFRERGGGGFRDDDRGGDRERWTSSNYGDRGSRDRDGNRDRGGGGGGGGGVFGPRRNYGGDREIERERDAEPKTRPKLQLQPRTKPVEPIMVKEETVPAPASDSTEPAQEDTDPAPTPAPAPIPAPASTPAPVSAPVSAPVPAANIFGAAKPVDTAAREREIEERLARSYAESRSKEENDGDKRPSRDNVWGRRNGQEGRDDREARDRPSRPTWRSEEDREKSGPRSSVSRSDNRGDSRGPPTVQRGGGAPRSQRPTDTRAAPPEKERREKEKDDEVNRMPKARDDQAPNFVASNKYSMLHDDVEPDDIED